MSGDSELKDPGEPGLVLYRLKTNERKVERLEDSLDALVKEVVRNTKATEANTSANDRLYDLVEKLNEKFYRTLIAVGIVAAALAAIGAKVVPFA